MTKNIGLVLQGGGALGAYEFGAVCELVNRGYIPTVISGVSIGAINAAAIAGARGGNIVASLENLWSRITLAPNPLFPDQLAKYQAMFGNPAFYQNRTDWWNMPNWTSFCDTAPIRQTLNEIVDFGQLNDPAHMRLCVTATDVATGGQVYFKNGGDTPITADHIVASGSLPPSFPATQIGERSYWDGGLFDNTPLRPVIDMITDTQVTDLPIVVIDLVPNCDAIPQNLADVKNRMMELSFENRFWDDFGGPQGLIDHANMLDMLDAAVTNPTLRNNPSFKTLMHYRAMKHLKVIPTTHQVMSDGMDFSQAGIDERRDKGKQAVAAFLAADQI